MTSFHAWFLRDAARARIAESRFGSALFGAGLTIADGAVMSWPAGRARPRLRPVQDIARVAALGDAFWGLLFGTLFFARADDDDSGHPTAVGLRRAGLTEVFCEGLRTALDPGTAAVVVLCDDRAADCAEAALAPFATGRVGALMSSGQLGMLYQDFTTKSH